MKNKKTIIVFSIVLAIACLFQLSFTFKARSFENQAMSFAINRAKKFKEDRGQAYRRYIDSLGNKDKYYDIGIASYSYFECKQREINLGLDLRGGMNVILEVDKGAIIEGLSNDRKDPHLLKAIEMANVLVRDKGGDYVNYFIESFKKIAPDRKLANLFVKGNSKGGIQPSSSESEVNAMLREETESAINRVYEVVEKRINQANVTQPTIQKVDGGRISVELPGVDNPRRMEDLVEKSANLEFYEVYGNTKTDNEGAKLLESLFKLSANIVEPGDTTVKSTTDTGKIAATKEDSAAKSAAEASKISSSPLAKLIKPVPSSAHVGLVKAGDRDKLAKMLASDRFSSIMEPGVKLAFSAKPAQTNAQGQSVVTSDEYEVYLLKRDRDGNAILSSNEENIISDSRANTNQTGGLEVSMEMTPQAASRWAQITGSNIGRFIAIVLDDRVYSAPVVQGKISGGNSQITGNFDIKEADDLSNVLKAGKLPAPARIVASEVVGPSLGQESITGGLNSLLAGFLIVIAFMVMYYNRAGWISIIAVLANVFLIMGVLSSLGAALTLPGMAGIILTVGMAVDSNVLIFERIKEELAKGKALRTAITDGYKHALSAIIDSNLTTLLAGIVLTFTGAGPAYGFAIILVIGIFSSLFTALLITRLLLDRRAEKGKDVQFGFKWNANFLKNTTIDFVSKRKIYYIISSIVIVAGISAFVMKGGINTGIDFKGGNAFILQFNPAKNYNVTNIKTALDKAFPKTSNEVKTFGSEGQYRIVTTHLLFETGNTDSEKAKAARDQVETDVLNALKGFDLQNVADTGTPVLSRSSVGAAIATSTRNKSAVLVMLAIIGIFVYIVFRFRSVSYGIGATIALIHDVIVVLSIFAILDGMVPFPTDFDQNLIAALLTLVGYSINDTVIVFDRIREYLNERRGDRNDKNLINMAINDTLSRTIITASTVFFVLLILFGFGGDALKGFSLALLVGVVVGTYSSICIATPIVVDMSIGKKSAKKE